MRFTNDVRPRVRRRRFTTFSDLRRRTAQVHGTALIDLNLVNLVNLLRRPDGRHSRNGVAIAGAGSPGRMVASHSCRADLTRTCRGGETVRTMVLNMGVFDTGRGHD
jgi:hypothetical protein